MSVGVVTIIAQEISRLEDILKFQNQTQKPLSLNYTSAVALREQRSTSDIYLPPIGKYVGIAIVSTISGIFLIYMVITITKLFQAREPQPTELPHLSESQNDRWPSSRQTDLEQQQQQGQVEAKEIESGIGRKYDLRNVDGMRGDAGDRGYRAHRPFYGPRIYRLDRPIRHGTG